MLGMLKYEFGKIFVILLILILLTNCSSLNVSKNKIDIQELNQELFREAFLGNTEIVKALLAKAADVNAKDNNGWTALLIASRNGYTKIVQALLAKGADVNLKANYDLTALMSAAMGGHTEAVKILLESGADAKIKTYDGGTALKLAEAGLYGDIVKLLRQAGATE